MTLSVIIPTWNEAAAIETVVKRARAVPEVVEIIISDGGSTDGTLDVARRQGTRIVTGAKGRGAQMRLGAESATGDVVLFLHADTWVRPAIGQSIARALQVPNASVRPIVGGAFYKRFRDAPWYMRGARFRSWAFFRIFGVPLGDQAIFVRRQVLEAVGGMPPLPLMEEFELVRRLRRVGKLVLLRPSVSASARRFVTRGVFSTYWRMTRVLWFYTCGTPPAELERVYEESGRK
ncbi:MAG TPA: TIGR04283 family arsenosugar biosynthesis glycosyltransferase [Candidatus Limnocylindria bacterium]|nr:TIGR04283 family arsenosugar biosynthesis glycosyltransferase [Candidatus Limnocylindria bacterium]